MDILVLFIAIITVVGMERVAALRFESLRFFRPFFGTDLIYFFTGAFALGLAARALALHLASAFGVSQLWPHMPFLLVAVVTVVLYDLGGYVSHWLLHRSEVLWRFHKVHHSSLRLDWLAAFRAHIVEHALRHLLSPVLLILAGFPLSAVGLAGAIYAGWAAFGHSNLRLALHRLESLFITPRLHRIHHVPGTSISNFGTIFSLWDRLGGTLHSDPAASLNPIGVPHEVATYPQTWLTQLLEPMRRRRGVQLAYDRIAS